MKRRRALKKRNQCACKCVCYHWTMRQRWADNYIHKPQIVNSESAVQYSPFLRLKIREGMELKGQSPRKSPCHYVIPGQQQILSWKRFPCRRPETEASRRSLERELRSHSRQRISGDTMDTYKVRLCLSRRVTSSRAARRATARFAALISCPWQLFGRSEVEAGNAFARRSKQMVLSPQY